MHTNFEGVHWPDGKLATVNMVPGRKVYGEDLVRGKGGIEYRLWNAHRSKLGGAILNGLKELPIKPGSKVLYLGASTGTTPSHVSDIIGPKGIIFCVEFAKRSMMDLVQLCEWRNNMIPLLEDARMPIAYKTVVAEEAGGKVDCIYEDVADSEQVRILLANAEMFLLKGGFAMIAVKARSIDATASPQTIFDNVLNELEPYFEIVQKFRLEPYDKDHLFLLLKKK